MSGGWWLIDKLIKGELVSSWQANNKYYILINCQGLGYEIQTLESVLLDININKISKKEIILWLKHIKKKTLIHLDLPQRIKISSYKF